VRVDVLALDRAGSGAVNVADSVVEKLAEEGVEVLFTVPGEQLDPLFASLATSSIRVVHARHEQGAALMAYGYARSTGRVGAYAVISGPGVLHTTAGLATGYAGDSRMLCIAGQIPTSSIGRGYGVPHEIPDQLVILRTLTSFAERLDHPDRVAAVVGGAFARLNAGRPRPVAVEIPADVLAAEVASPVAWPESLQMSPVDPASVEAAASVLQSARSPIMFVGSGARAASSEVIRLAERLLIPVTSEVGGRGVVPDDHELAVPLAVAHGLWAEADVVLGIGTRLMRPLVEWGVDDGLRVVRVDLDPDEITRVAPPEVGIVGDATAVTAAILDRVSQVQRRDAWLAAVASARQRVERELAQLAPQVAFLEALRAALPRNGFFVDELTQVGYVARIAFPVFQPSTYVPATYQNALGFGFATALGVKIANPLAPVLSIAGDGGFLYTASELATAVHHGIPVVAVIFNDNSYGNISRSQRGLFGGTLATDLHNPDFVAYARSFGAYAKRVVSPAALAEEVRLGFERTDVPTVVEVPVGEMPSPWSLIRLPRVRYARPIAAASGDRQTGLVRAL
jgi:acetolactate synthase-1/2/3 large subunit